LGIALKQKTLILLCVSALLVTLLGVVLYFAPPDVQSSGLIVQAFNDAQISFGSRTWMFFYESQPNLLQPVQVNFPFPFFSTQPGAFEALGGPPILISVLNIAGQQEKEGRLLKGTIGSSYSWDGMEITVVASNPFNIVLTFKPSS
jgi:hypothetical protein